MNIEEFGAKIKQKYPQYSDMSDIDLGQRMIKKYPQYKDMVNIGATTKRETESIQAGQKAQEFLSKPFYKQIFSKEAVKETPKSTLNVLVGTPAKFVTSATEIPSILKTGKATQKTYDLPGLEPFKSYQSEADTRFNKAIDINQTPSNLKANLMALQPFAEVPLAGVETAVTTKGLFGDVTLTGKNAGKSTSGLVQKGLSFLEKSKEKKAISSALQVTSPKIDKKLAESTIKKAGQPGGLKAQGLSKRFIRTPSQYDLDVAKDAAQIGVKNNNSVIKNSELLGKSLDEEYFSIENYLKSNSSQINPTYISDRLGKIKAPTTFRGDPENAYNAIKETAMDIIGERGSQTNYSLWQDRILIDDK